MSAVRKWNLFLRAIIAAITILILGVGAFRAGVIEDQSLALWPTLGLLHPEGLQGEQPLSSLALLAVAHVVIWTLLAYLLFSGFEGIRRGASRRR
jgi:hypothetical protein